MRGGVAAGFAEMYAYTRVKRNGKCIDRHRLVWEELHGPIHFCSDNAHYAFYSNTFLTAFLYVFVRFCTFYDIGLDMTT